LRNQFSDRPEGVDFFGHLLAKEMRPVGPSQNRSPKVLNFFPSSTGRFFTQSLPTPAAVEPAGPLITGKFYIFWGEIL
jgi:hypothetical protein